MEFLKNKKCPRHGFTLIEFLIVIALIGIIGSVLTLTLSTALDTYHVVSDDIVLQKFLDDTLQEIADGDYEHYGIKDALEFIQAGKNSIFFVPVWINDAHVVQSTGKEKKQQFPLEKQFKAGASTPIGQALFKAGGYDYWKTVPLTFQLREKKETVDSADFITLDEELPLGTPIRFLYHPEVTFHPEAIVVIEQSDHKIMRMYQGTRQAIPKDVLANTEIHDLTFQYFNNANSEILPDPGRGFIAPELLANITAVKVDLKVALGEKIKEGRAFMSIRNTRTSGAGLIIKEGMKIKIPDSDHIRVLSLTNIVGVEEGDQIVLEANAENKSTWRIEIDLGFKNDKAVIKKYAVYYPAGQKIYSEQINLTTDLPLDFLQLGFDGRYDYDVDEKVANIVELKGEVELTVLRMEVEGAALFIRP